MSEVCRVNKWQKGNDKTGNGKVGQAGPSLVGAGQGGGGRLLALLLPGAVGDRVLPEPFRTLGRPGTLPRELAL